MYNKTEDETLRIYGQGSGLNITFWYGSLSISPSGLHSIEIFIKFYRPYELNFKLLLSF